MILSEEGISTKILHCQTKGDYLILFIYNVSCMQSMLLQNRNVLVENMSVPEDLLAL